MSGFFRKPKSLGVNVIVALDLLDYATKADLNNEMISYILINLKMYYII